MARPPSLPTGLGPASLTPSWPPGFCEAADQFHVLDGEWVARAAGRRAPRPGRPCGLSAVSVLQRLEGGASSSCSATRSEDPPLRPAPLRPLTLPLPPRSPGPWGTAPIKCHSPPPDSLLPGPGPAWGLCTLGPLGSPRGHRGRLPRWSRALPREATWQGSLDRGPALGELSPVHRGPDREDCGRWEEPPAALEGCGSPLDGDVPDPADQNPRGTDG